MCVYSIPNSTWCCWLGCMVVWFSRSLACCVRSLSLFRASSRAQTRYVEEGIVLFVWNIIYIHIDFHTCSMFGRCVVVLVCSVCAWFETIRTNQIKNTLIRNIFEGKKGTHCGRYVCARKRDSEAIASENMYRMRNTLTPPAHGVSSISQFQATPFSNVTEKKKYTTTGAESGKKVLFELKFIW